MQLQGFQLPAFQHRGGVFLLKYTLVEPGQKADIEQLVQCQRRGAGKRFLVMEHVGIDESSFPSLYVVGVAVGAEPDAALDQYEKFHIGMPVPGYVSAGAHGHIFVAGEYGERGGVAGNLFFQIFIQRQGSYNHMAILLQKLAV